MTILVRDYLKKTRFFDQFTIGQETDRVFGVKGTVKVNEVATDGPSVTIEYMGKGGRVREVRISADGATVNKHPIVGVETREYGAVSLLYEQGGEIHTTSIKLPDTIVNQGKPVEADSLTTGFEYNDIQGKTFERDKQIVR